MLTDVVKVLACPLCGADLVVGDRTLRCRAGHGFDIARQGYVNLLPGNARTGTADTPEMVRSREAFLGAGHFAGLADVLAERAGAVLAPDACVLDAGAGTGYYLARLLDRAPTATGLAIDVSKHSLRRAARAHPRIGAVVADLWKPLPVRTAAAEAIINVFAPRNGAEFHRVLAPGGMLYVVTPTARHLGRLIPDLGLLKVDDRKRERTEQALRDHFVLDGAEDHEAEVRLRHDEVVTLVGMGPSAHHLAPGELQARLAELPDPVPVPLSVTISAYRPHSRGGRPGPR
ncbi:23S rRNA m(1)G-748 methyltransferase [Thermomonospora echinospora]|uniref:23S rRNA m(1)G-748 methyltransferase n=1 Tax=Thermomonospora echinospora TaxID=1992 RepID=A0A1H6EBZ1_9ACTN|nr:methyltransferase domain-containing protein [Thermomonospora echinospora]SEG94791.1 23S rRNA m(1)G-748 methyltransferase [Thermomonospora echinospora]